MGGEIRPGLQKSWELEGKPCIEKYRNIKLTKHDIYHIFDKDGLLEQNFPSYEYREGQLNMADLVRESFERNAIAAIEAGTGIGKSFAYLAVALYAAMQSPDERTVVATSTINLQKQLYEKDIPMLFKFLGLSCKIALAVGRGGNYLCINRFMQAKSDSSLLAQDPASELYQVGGQWIKESETGLFADFPGRLSGELKGRSVVTGGISARTTPVPIFVTVSISRQRQRRRMRKSSSATTTCFSPMPEPFHQ